MTVSLLSIMMLSGCGSSENKQNRHDSSSESSSEEKTTVALDDIEGKLSQYIDKNQFYQALDFAKKQESKVSQEDKQQLQQWQNAIELYQKAEDNYQDKRYDIAKDNADTIVDKSQYPAEMKDKASQLLDHINKAKSEKENKDKKESNKSKAKDDTSSLWNETKDKELSQFMVSWGNEMKQHYEKIRNENTPWGNINAIVDNSIDDDQAMNPAWEDGPDSGKTLIPTRWADNGDLEPNVYNVVAAYSSHNDHGNLPPNCSGILYLFTIHNNKPLVLVTKQNQGGFPNNALCFKETENQSLKQGFSSIVNS